MEINIKIGLSLLKLLNLIFFDKRVSSQLEGLVVFKFKSSCLVTLFSHVVQGSEKSQINLLECF